jgi:hypothetical protein
MDAGMAALAAFTDSPFWLFIEMTHQAGDYESPAGRITPECGEVFRAGLETGNIGAGIGKTTRGLLPANVIV